HVDRRAGLGLREARVFAGVDRRLRDLADPAAARQGFEAAPEAARAARATGLEDDMPDLAGETPRAAVERAVDHDPGRDPRPDAEIGEVRAIAGHVPRVEAGGRGSDVVLDADGNAEPGREPGAEGKVVPAEVDREGDGAVAGLHPAWD